MSESAQNRYLGKRKLTSDYVDFIDEEHLHGLLDGGEPEPTLVKEILAKSLTKESLSVAETATLLRCRDQAMIEEIYAAARTLKQQVYGNRIVIFAPLYVGNECVNNCGYCAFRRDNQKMARTTLKPAELTGQVRQLEDQGHKRLILVFGEHPSYDADFIAETVKRVYDTTSGHGEIRRVNINAAPLDEEGYRRVKASGIGTYQIFMESYHHATYRKYHPTNTIKGDYDWRLDGLSRGFAGGCDDMGLGVLFGLYDWRFEVLGMVTHSLHLQARYGVGPHTLSFPRIQPAHNIDVDSRWQVDDEDFKRLIAILRLAVPYTGLILTARENAELRRQVLEFGVSQIDAGSRIELGGYTMDCSRQKFDREQFRLGDTRSLDAVMQELLRDGYLPSFCTACYRLGRTGEHFMEFAVPGFIKRFCTPNGLTTLKEYLLDYATPETIAIGNEVIAAELAKIPAGPAKEETRRRLDQIGNSEQRDLYC